MMKTKLLFLLMAVGAFMSISCDKDTSADNNEPSGEYPELEEVDDVCTKMDDINFKIYCYDNFDTDGDAKVSMTEAKAVAAIECDDVTSFAGLEYFTNLKSFKSSSVVKVDFRYNKNLESINCAGSDIESADLSYNENLKSIIFYECELLTSVTLPDNLTSIERSAFYGCFLLESLEIPEGVTSIGSHAFYFCRSLKSVNIPDAITSIEVSTFEGCTSLESLEIPAGVTSIGSSAFYDCSSLESINIPEGVTSIPDRLFSGCSSLKSITIPAGVTGIADYAFLGCNSLESVDASQCLNIQEIGGEAFLYCPIKEFLLGTSNPPVFTSGESIFDNLSDAVLKVPAESVETYKNSDWAAYFGTVEAL